MKKTFAILLCLPFIGWSLARAIKSVQFNINCGDRMERAANASTVRLAIQEMEAVVRYLKENDLESGYTSILYRGPADDVGFWSENMKSSLSELKSLSPTATPLETSNVLMKLRETILTRDSKSEEIAVPDGISVFPNNAAYAFWGFVGFFLLIVGVVTFIRAHEEY